VRTLKIDYPKLVGEHGMEVLHITELLVRSNFPPNKSVEVKDALKITFQDPCNLGRHLGVYDPPRQVMTGAGYKLLEMERSRNASLCCGTSCWRACGQVSKSVQVERLKEAIATGAHLLVTACIKCQIHLKCAQNDPILGEEIDIDIRDITTILAEDL
jgi:Fe-S oxidoreductase